MAFGILENRPTLHFAFGEGCHYCAKAKAAIKALEPTLRGRIIVRMVDVLKGEQFPAAINAVPAFALTMPDRTGAWVLKELKQVTTPELLTKFLVDGFLHFREGQER